MQLRAKNVRASVSSTDGERLWLSRVRPRNDAAQLDGWERDLAPSTKLDFALWRHWITAREHAALFVAEIWSHAPQLRALGQRATLHPVTLVCGCTEPSRCRCNLVVELVARLCKPRSAMTAAR